MRWRRPMLPYRVVEEVARDAPHAFSFKVIHPHEEPMSEKNIRQLLYRTHATPRGEAC